MYLCTAHFAKMIDCTIFLTLCKTRLVTYLLPIIFNHISYVFKNYRKLILYNHITFTLRQSVVPSVSLENKIMPPVTKVKYLGLILDKRLTWAEHINQKRLLLKSRRKCLYPLLGANNPNLIYFQKMYHAFSKLNGNIL